MTFEEINKMPIREYLAGLNYQPAKEYGYYGMFRCPFRDDRNASFKVDYSRNLWYDFGINEGGSFIDLIMKLENCTFKEAVNRFEGKCADIRINKSANIFLSPVEQERINSVIDIFQVTHPQLIVWLQERKIEPNLANLYCREIHYRNRGKDYFSIGFGNDKGGYELSSPSGFKGCIPPKDITTISNNRDVCLVFEGFWDFLSYLALQKAGKTKHDVAILNSVANVQKALPFLKTHREVYTYLDNDNAGVMATQVIRKACITVFDRSVRYAGFKDLNDYLRNKPVVTKDID
ncbi:MAG: toprim domain-containing protein [Tannerellaceae bacterium]|jgi:DNA primase|nr:toprim domain-containing protein [Tannerellaceae bacterium]